MRVAKIKLYAFSELNPAIQKRVLDENRYINLERSWWRDIEEDAENIGIRITNFDDKFCYGHLIDDA